jgi:hypothetical protein
MRALLFFFPVAAAVNLHLQPSWQGAAAQHLHMQRKVGPIAVLSLSGRVRTQADVCKQQLKMIVQANPDFTFDVFHVSDAPSSDICVAATRAEPNVRNVTVLQTASPPPRFQCTGDLCQALFKQYVLRDAIINSSAYSQDDVFIHTRFDVTIDSPLNLKNLMVKSNFFVLRSTWFQGHSKGNIYDQIAFPISWRGRTLSTSVPDYAFIGSWEHMSVALKRFELLSRLIRGTAVARCECKRGCQRCPEELLGEALRREGISFNGHGPGSVQLLFARPSVTIIRPGMAVH